MKIVRSNEGRQVKVLTDDMCIKLGSKESKRMLSVMTLDIPVGSFVPPHFHAVEEESFYVLEGSLTMLVDQGQVEVRAGDFVHLPEETMHGYRNDGQSTCRVLVMTAGGPLDSFFIEMSDNIKNIPEDLPKMPDILAKYRIEMPPPA
jgi:quercetin dioxygenase-like cupin family protein